MKNHHLPMVFLWLINDELYGIIEWIIIMEKVWNSYTYILYT